MTQRVPVTSNVDPSILGEKLNFQTSNRLAENRFLKAALTEKLLTYDKNNLKFSGIPNQRLINLYSKWAHGGFGVILTGNVIVDPNHLEAPGNAIIDKSIDSEERRSAFKKLAYTMKSGGSLAIVQLNHAGRQTQKSINEHPYSASDVPLDTFKFAKNNKMMSIMSFMAQLRLLKKILFNWCLITGYFC
uniref:NADH:flavin oxidoreductase/NADH oxidase N-terminal domain-containing protein n=1 Tax=Acrobeloides nanus TaxID=290746 RepID=A0A914CF04_9BILA